MAHQQLKLSTSNPWWHHLVSPLPTPGLPFFLVLEKGITIYCFQTMMLEKPLENPLDSKEIKPVNPKGNQPWIFIEKTDVEAEAPILWPPDAKNLLRKDPDAGKDWRQKEKGAAEDEMVRQPHQLNGHEFWANSGRWWRTEEPGVLQSMGHKESDTT